LAASGIAATFYAANCTDDSALFVITWYPIAILIVTTAAQVGDPHLDVGIGWDPRCDSPLLVPDTARRRPYQRWRTGDSIITLTSQEFASMRERWAGESCRSLGSIKWSDDRSRRDAPSRAAARPG
jgi:hypothetical protein